MAESSKILLGLPNLPDNELDKKLWSELLTVYRAIQNLLQGVSVNTGIDAPDDLEISSMDPTKYLLGENISRWYPTAAFNISRGQLVGIGPGLGSNAVQKATAVAGGGIPAVGVADETKTTGQKIKILVGGVTTAFSGMVPGSHYYLSPTAGAIQNLRPIAAGEIVQYIGFALTSNQLLLNISGQYQQL